MLLIVISVSGDDFLAICRKISSSDVSNTDISYTMFVNLFKNSCSILNTCDHLQLALFTT